MAEPKNGAEEKGMIARAIDAISELADEFMSPIGSKADERQQEPQLGKNSMACNTLLSKLATGDLPKDMPPEMLARLEECKAQASPGSTELSE